MGVLYARVAGAWVPISSGGTSEVEIGTDDPIGANANAELWFDTDDDVTAPPTTPPAWTPLTLANGWTAYDSGRVPAYRKVGDVVSLRGTVKPGTTTTIATLPVGFRTPLTVQAWPVDSDATKTTALALADGRIQVSAIPPTYAVLDPVSFSVTP